MKPVLLRMVLGIQAAILSASPIHLVAADAPEPIVLKGHSKSVSSVAWSADSKTLATASDDRSIRIWDVRTGNQSALLEGIASEGYRGPVVAFTQKLDIAAVNYRGEITIRSVSDNKLLAKFDPILDRTKRGAFRPDVYAMAFSPDGMRLATAGSAAAVGGSHGLPGGIASIWDVKSCKSIHHSEPLSTAASSVTWSADGKILVAGTSGAGGELQEAGEVWVWDAESMKKLHTLPVKSSTKYGEWASAADVAVSSDGSRVAAPVTAGSRGIPAGELLVDTGAFIRIWDLKSGKDILSIKGLKKSIGRVVFSPDSRQLGAVGIDKVVRLWDAGSGMELAAWPCPEPVTAVAFSPDGKFLATGSNDGTIRIWPVPASN